MKYLLIVLAIFFSGTCYSQINERPGKTHTHHGHDEDDDEDEDDDDCLPIDLIDFKATSIHNAVKITWATASETDNDYFTLFRSPNGFEYWELVDKISGAGNSNILTTYSYIDTNPSDGVNYYVLTQTDYNGTRVQFDPIAVQFIQIPEYDVWEYYNVLGQEIK
jgi:hypothetical protein